MSYKNRDFNIEVVQHPRQKLCDWSCKILNSKYKQIGNQIGNGTYGSVYKAEIINKQANISNENSSKNKNFVALKKLKFENEKQGFPLSALREISILKQLDHPNLLKLLDVVVDEQSTTKLKKEINQSNKQLQSSQKSGVYLVFEYMEHDLSALLLNNIQFSMVQIKSIMFQIIQGLKYLHNKNIWHRDLKSANILYNNCGEIKIADFGLSKNIQKQKKINTNRVVTLWYRAPELLLGSETYSSKVDIWSLGCLFAELILGKPLFQGDNEARQIEQIYQKCGGFSQKEWPESKSYKYYYMFHPQQSYKRTIQSFIRSKRSNIEAQALEFLDKLLQINPNQRISIDECLQHPYFQAKPKILALNEMPRFEKECHLYQTQQQNLINNNEQQKKIQQQIIKKNMNMNNVYNNNTFQSNNNNLQQQQFQNCQQFQPQLQSSSSILQQNLQQQHYSHHPTNQQPSNLIQQQSQNTNHLFSYFPQIQQHQLQNFNLNGSSFMLQNNINFPSSGAIPNHLQQMIFSQNQQNQQYLQQQQFRQQQQQSEQSYQVPKQLEKLNSFQKQVNNQQFSRRKPIFVVKKQQILNQQKLNKIIEKAQMKKQEKLEKLQQQQDFLITPTDINITSASDDSNTNNSIFAESISTTNATINQQLNENTLVLPSSQKQNQQQFLTLNSFGLQQQEVGSTNVNKLMPKQALNFQSFHNQKLLENTDQDNLEEDLNLIRKKICKEEENQEQQQLLVETLQRVSQNNHYYNHQQIFF